MLAAQLEQHPDLEVLLGRRVCNPATLLHVQPEHW